MLVFLRRRQHAERKGWCLGLFARPYGGVAHVRGDGDQRGPVCAWRELEKAAESNQISCDPQGLVLVELDT